MANGTKEYHVHTEWKQNTDAHCHYCFFCMFGIRQRAAQASTPINHKRPQKVEDERKTSEIYACTVIKLHSKTNEKHRKSMHAL